MSTVYLKELSSLVNSIVDEMLSCLRKEAGMRDVFEWSLIRQEVIDDLLKISLQVDTLHHLPNSDQIKLAPFISFLRGMILRRAERLRFFLIKIASAIRDFCKEKNVSAISIAVHLLEADSHNQGERPIVFKLGSRKYVLKFRDPRPYKILKHVLQTVEDALEIKICPPPIWHSKTYDWYVMPYLENNERTSQRAEQAIFMKRLGILTATAYFLQMTDIHFENVLVSEGIPIIVDPECMFYGYSEYQTASVESRLWDTGLVSINPQLSAIRGGSDLIWDFGPKVEGSKISYMRQVKGSQQHRLLNTQSQLVEPEEFSTEILEGFSNAYTVLCYLKEQLIEEINAIAGSNMRTRFLLRLTAHYATVIEMLRHPTHENETIRLGKVVSSFLKSAGLSKQISDKTQRCELLDMLDCDFPFFWAEEVQGQAMLMHWSGNVGAFPSSDSLRQRIDRAAINCSLEDLPILKKSFENFLYTKAQPAQFA